MKLLKKFCLLCFLNHLIIGISKASSDECCSEILPENYEIHKAPENEGGSNNVYIALEVIDIGQINEEKMVYHFDTFLNIYWKDNRLKLDSYKNSTRYNLLNHCCLKRIWTPIIFFEKAKSIENFESLPVNAILEVLPDGTFLKSSRYIFESGCRMNFADYPFDTQKCPFHLGLMYSDSNTVLKWISDESSPFKDILPIVIVRKCEPLQFSLNDPTVESVTEVISGENYTNLYVNLTFKRRLTGSIINTYAPSTLIVLMSWVTFWMSMNAVPGRVALSVTSLLTLCTQVQQYKSELPAVSYMKAMDIWLFACIFCVFSTLLEFAIAYNLSMNLCKECSRGKMENFENAVKKEHNSKENLKKMNSWHLEKENVSDQIYATRPSIKEQDIACKSPKHCKSSVNTTAVNIPCQLNKERSVLVDKISQKLFPLLFLTFNVIYWIYYLNKSVT